MTSTIRESKHERGLVLVRAGIEHRMDPLLHVPRDCRNWDLAVSIYDEMAIGNDACVEFLHYHHGGKWDGIYAFFRDNPESLDAFDYFWLVDDDIETSAIQVDSLFQYMRSQNMEIAQPALTLDSFYSHRLTLQCPAFSHRNTNFVELMMPILSRNVLHQTLSFFVNSRSGLGLDWLWYRFVSRPAESVAIIDAIAISHRRPLNQHLRGRMKREGLSAQQERRRAIEDWNLRRIYPIAFAGILINGMRVDSRIKMSLLMTKSYWEKRRTIIRPKWHWMNFLIFLIRQAFSKV